MRRSSSRPQIKHILLIDPLEKLVLAKDSTLLLAHTLKDSGREVYLLFERDLLVTSEGPPLLRVFSFESSLQGGGFYLQSFVPSQEHSLALDENVLLHIRLDPPFDQRYLKCLWMLSWLKQFGVQLFNDPQGLLLFNEKLLAFQAPSHLETYVGSSWQTFLVFAQSLETKGHEQVVLKPLDYYQGIGVEKVVLFERQQLKEVFQRKVVEYQGAILAQPFVHQVAAGEQRAVFWGAQHLGTILKVPPCGEFLANVAMGASYSMVELSAETQRECEQLYHHVLAPHGLHWVAYDILDGHINEVNVTCPGLLVELSMAFGRNLALGLIPNMESSERCHSRN